MPHHRRHNAVQRKPNSNVNSHAIAAQDKDDAKRGGRKSRHHLVSYDELPVWYQDNKHILHGYRPESLSTAACFLSWTYLHNETFNIYSHLIPAIAFFLAQALSRALLHERYPAADSLDHVVLLFFLCSACAALSLSFLYHTLMNHSKPVSYLWLRLDYVGILALTLGDFVSGIRVGFYCDPGLQKIYWSMTLALGTLTTLLVIHPKYFRGPRHRTLRVAAFVSLALSGFIPIAHGLVIYGAGHMWRASGLPYYLLEGGLLILGALVYATRYPESASSSSTTTSSTVSGFCFFSSDKNNDDNDGDVQQGRFDLLGNSHNIFHVLVVLATVVHLVGISKAFAYHYHHVHCPSLELSFFDGGWDRL